MAIKSYSLCHVLSLCLCCMMCVRGNIDFRGIALGAPPIFLNANNRHTHKYEKKYRHWNWSAPLKSHSPLTRYCSERLTQTHTRPCSRAAHSTTEAIKYHFSFSVFFSFLFSSFLLSCIRLHLFRLVTTQSSKMIGSDNVCNPIVEESRWRRHRCRRRWQRQHQHLPSFHSRRSFLISIASTSSLYRSRTHKNPFVISFLFHGTFFCCCHLPRLCLSLVLPP